MRAACLVPARGLAPARGLLAAGRLRAGSLCTGYGGLDLAVMAMLDIVLAWCALRSGGDSPDRGMSAGRWAKDGRCLA